MGLLPTTYPEILHFIDFKTHIGQAPVAYAYNPSYSGGRDQEDCSSKPAQVNSSQDPISKKTITKKGWWSGSSSSPSTTPKKKKKRHTLEKLPHL
jgi:hypothetical protein